MGFIRKIHKLTLDDAELLVQYKNNGNAELLAQLFDRYIEMVYAVCIRYLKDPETSKDAVMDIFEQLAPKVQRHEISSFHSWLYTVTRNHCLMYLRSKAKTISVNIDEEHMQSGEDLHQEDVNEKEKEFTWLASCMEALAEEQRKIIELFYLQQKCYREIATITGFEWNKVRSLVQNGRRNLKICMDREKQYEQ